jgi:iron complex transport system substrate-binding protein
LLNKEKLVNEKFAKIESEYERLRKLAAGSETKPSIISGLNTKDAWFLPSGDGYMAQFFRDAGADYHWSNTKSSGSLPLNFESVYPIALKADYWVNVGFGKNDTRKDILAQDSRYADFNAYKSGKMFSYNNLVNEQGSNDFFESGNVKPHIVLSDLIKIFILNCYPITNWFITNS